MDHFCKIFLSQPEWLTSFFKILAIETSGSGLTIEFHWDYVGAAHKVKKVIEKHISVDNGL